MYKKCKRNMDRYFTRKMTHLKITPSVLAVWIYFYVCKWHQKFLNVYSIYTPTFTSYANYVLCLCVSIKGQLLSLLVSKYAKGHSNKLFAGISEQYVKKILQFNFSICENFSVIYTSRPMTFLAMKSNKVSKSNLSTIKDEKKYA